MKKCDCSKSTYNSWHWFGQDICTRCYLIRWIILFLVCLSILVVMNSCSANDTDRLHPVVITEQCDMMEVNHYYDEHGKLIFDQVIFYDWEQYDPIDDKWRYQIRAWRLMEKPEHVPTKDWPRDMWSVIFRDCGHIRSVKAPVLKESWTQYDPEEFKLKDNRRELLIPR